MTVDLSNFRKNYEKNSLLEFDVPEKPFLLFDEWFQQEKKLQKDNEEINAMSLSTIGEDGCPETRVVLLKEYSENGFIFYTNYFSSKGKSIQNIPKVCISFYWKKMERQIIIKGITSKVQKKKSDEYFHKRPRENQIGSWASRQSMILPSKKYLFKQYNKWKDFFDKKIIKRPFDWGGYIVKPYKMEFWQGQPNRLHDRLIYILKKEKKWILYRFYP
ncbi:pyridoxamine 5'-phosphate oxidase [Blattabacterium cuenoti]|uniref:Pyridoxine/pyridoxamine 5'-phosphate oxidase n=1 Tax=Blattabacterium cuenoti STAT TaxID=1457030 RepID=A0A224AK11_9FLAO|nr:pyridoxamine 5'-phosphate oxidase [Blattabacterium cuenoti]BBA17491.1 polyphosphate kinase [Blattabacterium cuenoti STAT]